MITYLISIILSIIIGIFIIHFIGLWVSSKIYHKKRGWGFKLGNRFELHVTSEKSLMIDFTRYYKWYVDEESIDTNMYSHNIHLTIGGFKFIWKYGNNPIDKPDDYYNDFCDTKYYGLYSVDGEIFWNDIWWGNHLYNNPFACNKFLGCYVLDIDNGKLINKNILIDYNKEYNPNIKFPYVYEKENDTYVNKNGIKQHVPEIKFYYEKRSWCPPILYYLKLSWLYIKNRVDLEFECSNNGDKTFDGIGVKANNSWKGGVYGSSIQINKYPELYNMFNKISVGQLNELSRFKYMTNNLIKDFMLYQKKY